MHYYDRDLVLMKLFTNIAMFACSVDSHAFTPMEAKLDVPESAFKQLKNPRKYF